jgi:hypothetical protein
MYCRRNSLIATLDSHFSIGVISLDLTEENYDMESVNIDDLEDVVSNHDESKDISI